MDKENDVETTGITEHERKFEAGLSVLSRSMGFPPGAMTAQTKLNGITAGWLVEFAIRMHELGK